MKTSLVQQVYLNYRGHNLSNECTAPDLIQFIFMCVFFLLLGSSCGAVEADLLVLLEGGLYGKPQLLIPMWRCIIRQDGRISRAVMDVQICQLS